MYIQPSVYCLFCYNESLYWALIKLYTYGNYFLYNVKHTLEWLCVYVYKININRYIFFSFTFTTITFVVSGLSLCKNTDTHTHTRLDGGFPFASAPTIWKQNSSWQFVVFSSLFVSLSCVILSYFLSHVTCMIS